MFLIATHIIKGKIKKLNTVHLLLLLISGCLLFALYSLIDTFNNSGLIMQWQSQHAISILYIMTNKSTHFAFHLFNCLTSHSHLKVYCVGNKLFSVSCKQTRNTHDDCSTKHPEQRNWENWPKPLSKNVSDIYRNVKTGDIGRIGF